MKKLLLLALISPVMILMSCGGDDPEPTEEDFLRQSWVLDSYIYENLPADVSYWGDSEFTTVLGENKFSINFSGSHYTRGMRFALQAGGDTTFTESGEYTFSDNEILLDPTGSGLGAILSSAFGVQVAPLSNVYKVETITESDLVVSFEESDFLTSNDWSDYIDENFNTQQELDDYLNGLSDDQYDSLVNAVLIPVTFDVVYDFDLDVE